MPPEGDRLSAAEIDLLKVWIDQGARWPDELAGDVQDRADWWSLRPLPLIDSFQLKNGDRPQSTVSFGKNSIHSACTLQLKRIAGH